MQHNVLLKWEKELKKIKGMGMKMGMGAKTGNMAYGINEEEKKSLGQSGAAVGMKRQSKQQRERGWWRDHPSLMTTWIT